MSRRTRPLPPVHAKRGGLCGVGDCDREVKSSGVCNGHTARYLRDGDFRSTVPLRASPRMRPSPRTLLAQLLLHGVLSESEYEAKLKLVKRREEAAQLVQQLDALQQVGILSQVEFDTKKAEVLSRV